MIFKDKKVRGSRTAVGSKRDVESVQCCSLGPISPRTFSTKDGISMSG